MFFFVQKVCTTPRKSVSLLLVELLQEELPKTFLAAVATSITSKGKIFDGKILFEEPKYV